MGFGFVLIGYYLGLNVLSNGFWGFIYCKVVSIVIFRFQECMYGRDVREIVMLFKCVLLVEIQSGIIQFFRFNFGKILGGYFFIDRLEFLSLSLIFLILAICVRMEVWMRIFFYVLYFFDIIVKFSFFMLKMQEWQILYYFLLRGFVCIIIGRVGILQVSVQFVLFLLREN